MILVPIFYFTKRLIFTLILIVTKDYLWVQVFTMTFMTLSSASYILYYKPLDSPKANMIEVFNDCTVLTLIYLILCFTDIVEKPETR